MLEVQITKDNFQKEVLDYKGTVILDFYGTWCMPCKMLAPIVEKVCVEQNIKLAKLDIDEYEELVRQFKIMSVPTLKIFKDGKEVQTSVGLVSENRILELIK
jgi:thioredoxin 1